MTALAAPNEFSSAYQAHWPRAFSSAFRVLGDAAAAEDVVQDVFLTLWRNPGPLRPARGNLGGYVAMMARSRAVDRVRSIGAGRAAVERLGVRDEDRPGDEDGPSASAIRRDERGRILVGGQGPSGSPARRRAAGLRQGPLRRGDRGGVGHAARNGKEPAPPGSGEDPREARPRGLKRSSPSDTAGGTDRSSIPGPGGPGFVFSAPCSVRSEDGRLLHRPLDAADRAPRAGDRAVWTAGAADAGGAPAGGIGTACPHHRPRRALRTGSPARPG